MRKFYLLVTGFIAGILSSTLGIGGGVVVVPALIVFFKYEMKTAVGISLATIVPISFVGIIIHSIIKSSNIKFLAVLLVLCGSIIGAKLGASLLKKINSKLLCRLFSLLLLFTALKLVGILKIGGNSISNTSYFPFLIVLGLAAGLLSALLGIGGGVIIVPALNLFFGLTMHQAIATSLTIIFPTALSGTFFHKKLNNLDIPTIKLLIPLSVVGVILGVIVLNILPASTLKLIFSIFLFSCSVKLFLHR